MWTFTVTIFQFHYRNWIFLNWLLRARVFSAGLFSANLFCSSFLQLFSAVLFYLGIFFIRVLIWWKIDYKTETTLIYNSNDRIHRKKFDIWNENTTIKWSDEDVSKSCFAVVPSFCRFGDPERWQTRRQRQWRGPPPWLSWCQQTFLQSGHKSASEGIVMIIL